jgi:hypothetical protein
MAEPAAKASTEIKDDREILTRNFGEKYHAYFNKIDSFIEGPVENILKRPIHSSVYWREMPYYQGTITGILFLFVIMRKLPFTNPAVRIGCWILGIDIARTRRNYFAPMTDDVINELNQFDLIKQKVLSWTGIRTPDYYLEYEDWYMFNKPAYRVPVGMEQNPDAFFRYTFLNMKKYEERPVKWHGHWEQENALNLDLQAPHADSWLTTH